MSASVSRRVASSLGALVVFACFPGGAPAATADAGGAPTAPSGQTHAFVTVPRAAQSANALADAIAGWRRAPGVSRVLVLDARAPEPGSDETPGFSTLVLLDFSDDGALARWRAAAHVPPGVTVRQADAVVRGEARDRDPAQATYEVNVYRLTTTPDEYRRFCEGYIVPLMDGQRDRGLLSWYTMYVERAPAGEANSVLVKEYRSDAAYAEAATFKPVLRARLTAEHPTYPRYHEIKGTLRQDLTETVAKARH